MAKRKRSSKQHPSGMIKRKRPTLDLSDLPMDILCCIVSRLPIKEAVRTSILSSHWKHVWCARTNLKFTSQSMLPMCHIERSWTSNGEEINKQDFIQRVNAVLKQHSGTGVEKMLVGYPLLGNECADHIYRWLNFAIASKTKHLILDFTTLWYSKAPYNFPFQLFDDTSSSHLQSLELGSVYLKQPTDFTGFLNLQKFKLVDVKITEEDLQLLLSNCKVLRFLEITGCRLLRRLRILHPSKHLKHLQVKDCPLLQEIELASGLTTLEYRGQLIPLTLPHTSLIRNICMRSPDICGALGYIFTELPNILPRLKMLTLQSLELERATLRDKPLRFIHLRHLTLELTFFAVWKRKTDALDFGCLLEAAPFLEKLDFHMYMYSPHIRYRKRHGELRSLPSHPHSHLKFVHIKGFYGQKDQLELALHILRNSSVLEAMKVDPTPVIDNEEFGLVSSSEGSRFLDGYRVAKKYLRKEDHRNVLDLRKITRWDVENISAYKLVDPTYPDLPTDLH